jgi:transcriptional regulator with XRE-family HTH domain
MSFRDNLRETLDFIDMQQKELAAKTGLSQKTIENYVKKGASIPTADKAVLIAQALGVTVEYLVTGKENAYKELAILLAKHKEIIDILSKLDNYNYKVIVSMARTLLSLQPAKKT